METRPNLHGEGAWLAHQRGPTYTRTDLDTVVRFAAERGVRIVAEIDIPGHAGR